MSALLKTTRVLCSKLLRNTCKRAYILEARSVVTDANDHSVVSNTVETEANTSSSQENVDLSSQESFATMLRKSKFMQMGCPVNNPLGALLFGKITHVVGDDLYIDFGGKFPCVCKVPKADSW